MVLDLSKQIPIWCPCGNGNDGSEVLHGHYGWFHSKQTEVEYNTMHCLKRLKSFLTRDSGETATISVKPPYKRNITW